MIFYKKDRGELCKGLTKQEIKCKCLHPECTVTIVSDELIRCFEAFRKAVGQPLTILSGYRCLLHQKDLLDASAAYKKANPNTKITSEPGELSRHMTGEALDISLVGLKKSPDELKKIALQCGFNYCYYDTTKNFLHIDCR